MAEPSFLRWALLLLVLALPATGSAADFQVISGEIRLVDETYVLDVHIEYKFSETALEALGNGVPLTLDVHVQMQRDDAWLWEQRPLDRHLRFLIRYLSLAQLYQVVNLDDGTQQNFVTREAAITALGELIAIPLVERSTLQAGERYIIKVKAVLDIEALPLPLRPLAYLSPSWNLSSKWRKWPLQP